MKSKKGILLLAILVTSASQLCTGNFKTIDQLKTYVSFYQEYPDIDNDNWLNPDYTSFHKANLPGWMSNFMRFLGFSRKPVWSPKAFATLLQDVINERETNGYIGRFVQKFIPPPDSKLVIFGDLHASFHSLTRDLLDMYEDGIINQKYKFKDGYYLVFAGNAIDLSPFNLETLTLILHLMKANPYKVFYLRGKHEDKEHWRNFGLRRELNLRASGVVPEKLIKRFFGTAPLALYLIGRTGKKTEVVRISSFSRDHQELDEDNFADFFMLDKNKKEDVRSLKTKARVSQAVDVKVIIKCEDRLTKHTPTEGLVQTDSDRGSTSWLVTSGPNRTFRSLYKFFFDAFAIIKTNGQVDNWTISLYNQDVREKLGITKRKEYNLVSGDEISVETKREKTLEQKLRQVRSELETCKTKTKKLKEEVKKEVKAEVKKEVKEEIKKEAAPTPPREKEITKKEKEIAQKEAELAKKEAELAKKAAELAKGKQPPPAAVGPEEIVVGTTLGLTGNIKEESESVRLGLQLRIDEENRKGGINGKKIRLVVLDDAYQPTQARANALELINKYKVDIILFSTGSATTKSYLDLVQEKKVVVLFTSSGSPALRSPTPDYFIHFRPSYPTMAEALISYAQKNLEAKKFALVSQRDITAAGLLETMKIAGITANNFIEVTHKRNVTDMSKQAEQIKTFKPDVIVLWTTSSASTAIIKELGAENLINTKMLGADLRNPRFNAFLQTMGLARNYIDSQALPNPETSPIPILKEYRSKMGNKPIDGLSAEAYVGASIFIYLLKQTGGITEKSTIIKAAENIKNLNLGGLDLNFDKKKRRLSRFIWLTTGKDWTAVDVGKLEEEKEKKAAEEKAKKEAEKLKRKAVQIEKEAAKQAEKEVKAPAEKIVVAAGSEEIVVGTTLGLTGNIREESESVRLGLQLRIDKKNLAGGVGGKKIRLIVLDDGYQPVRARENALELINKHKVDIILFPTGSATTKAYLDLVKEKKVVVLFTSSGSPALRSPTPDYFVHLRPSYPAMFDALISYAQKNLEAKKFALVSQRDITAEGLADTMKKAGIPSSNLIEVSHKRNITDMSSQAEQIKKFKPDIIVLWTTSSASMAIIKEVGAENLINTKMLGADLRNPRFNSFLETMGLSANYIDAQAMPNPGTSQIPILKEYRSIMGTRPIDGLSAEAYVGADIFLYLLEQTGGITEKKEIIQAAKNIKNLDLGGLKLNYEKGRLSRFIWLTTGVNWTAVNVNGVEQKKEKKTKPKTTTVEKNKTKKVNKGITKTKKAAVQRAA